MIVDHLSTISRGAVKTDGGCLGHKLGCDFLQDSEIVSHSVETFNQH